MTISVAQQPAALAQAMPLPVAGDAGDHGKIDLVQRHCGAVGLGLQDAVSSRGQVVKACDPPQLHDPRSGAEGDAEPLPLPQGRSEELRGVDLPGSTHKGEDRLGHPEFRQG